MKYSSPKLASTSGKFICTLGAVIALLLGVSLASAATFTVTSNTNWSAIGGGPPTASDSVYVRSGATLTVNVANAVCGAIQVGSNRVSGSTGTLSFNSGSQLTVSGLVYLGGTSSGSITMTSGGILRCRGFLLNILGTWTPGYGTVQLTADNSLPNNVNFAFFNNLTINGGNTTLGQSISVSGTLTLTSGTLTTGAYQISVTSSAAAAVVATNGIIDGQITRMMANNASTYIFNDASCTITRISGTNPTSVTVKSFPNTTVPYGNPALVARRYYTITATGGSGAWDLTLSYRNAGVDERNSLNQSLFSLWKGNGSVWVDQLGTQSAATNPPNSGKVTTNGVTSFSDWTFAETGGTLPIQLASFSGSVLQNANVALAWVTLSEVNNYGFYIQRKRPGEQVYFEIPNSFVPGHGTTNEPQMYSFTDVAPGSGAWMYRLKQMDLDGSIHYAEPIQIDVLTGVTEKGTMPTVYELNQNYPNPFNPGTTVSFAIPRPGHVTLRVYNLLGAEVAMIIDGDMQAGYHSTNWNAAGLASGVYMYQLTAGRFVETKKLTLMK